MANPAGPPFYRLRLQGKSGSSAISYTTLESNGYEAGYAAGYAQGLLDAGPGAGAAGTLSYNSGVAGLTFGVDPVPDTKIIAFSGTGGEFYAGRLVFTGDANSFQITAVGGDTRDIPFDCNSGDFVFGFDEGVTLNVTFKAVYTDGTAKSMTVTMYDIDGTVVDTISATTQIINPFLTLIESDPDLLRSWYADALNDGDIYYPDVVMEDSRGLAGDLVSSNAAPQYWQRGLTGVGAFKKAVESVGPGVTGIRLINSGGSWANPETAILIAYIDFSLMGGGFNFFQAHWGTSGRAVLRATPTAFTLFPYPSGGSVLAVPHAGVSGWYAFAYTYRASPSDLIYMSATMLEPGFTYGNVGETSAAQYLDMGDPSAVMFQEYILNDILGDTRYACAALFSAYKTPTELATFIESLEPTL